MLGKPEKRQMVTGAGSPRLLAIGVTGNPRNLHVTVHVYEPTEPRATRRGVSPSTRWVNLASDAFDRAPDDSPVNH